MPGLDALTAGAGQTDQRDARHAIGGLIAVQGPTVLDARTGVLVGPNSLQILAPTTKTGPTMSVLIKAHHSITSRGAANGPYLGPTLDADAEVNVDLAPGSGSRIDVVWERQRDTTSGVPSPDASSGPEYGVLKGTPSTGTPAKPDLAALGPAGASELGTLTIPAGATSTSSASVTITQTARQTTGRGGVILCRTEAERLALTAYGSLQAIELDSGRRAWHDGARWRYEGDLLTVASAAARTALTAATLYDDLVVVERDTLNRWRRVSGAWVAVAGDNLPLAQLRQTVAQTGLPNAWQLITFDVADVDTHGGWTAGAKTRWTCPAGHGGVYAIEGEVEFGTTASPLFAGARLLKNGAVLPASKGSSGVITSSGALSTATTGRYLLTLAVGDYVEMQGWIPGTGWQTAATGEGGPRLVIERRR